MGKLGYVAPEQASLERRWDHRVDLFAAGILLYELLTKQKPFPRATDVESLVTRARRGWSRPRRWTRGCRGRSTRSSPRRSPTTPRSATPTPELRRARWSTCSSRRRTRPSRTCSASRCSRSSRSGSPAAEARAHDALIMKVLTNLAEKQARRSTSGPARSVAPARRPRRRRRRRGAGAAGPRRRMATEPRPLGAAPAAPAPRRAGASAWSAAALAGAVLAAGGAAALSTREILAAPGVLVGPASRPAPRFPGRRADGAQRTPAVLEGVEVRSPTRWRSAAQVVRTATVAVNPSRGG